MQRTGGDAQSETSVKYNHITSASVKAICPIESGVILSHPVFVTIQNYSRGKNQSLEAPELEFIGVLMCVTLKGRNRI